ncbi:PQQ-binding-like beta-propeller repeat protein (plasmid) [Halorussus limi]|uniref:PQQ-binding-like beta-propeller repeat protein n=1 Tax=Halorussus limi TaxID=2938695 RepID=A0A8U0HYU9_9EURY|nr:PQQ-binding-like beta-propeller repeat protein [Halorussus limi]UPV76342.1 PQQ-binding-like beta-propeller repeat protein [Halorussus limi]
MFDTTPLALDRRRFLAAVGSALPATGFATAFRDDRSSSDDDSQTDQSSDSDSGNRQRPDWRLTGFDATNVGYHPDLTGPKTRARERWRRDAAVEGVVAADGVVYASTERDVVAFDAETGEEKWRTRVCDNATSQNLVYTPAVADGRVFASTFAETLYALDAETGETRWEYGLDHRWGGRILAADADAVYATDDSRRAFAVDAETGRERWEYRYGEPLPSTPVVADGTLYLGYADRSVLRAVEVESDRQRWEQSGPGDEWVEAMTVADGTVYAGWGLPGEEPGHLTAIDDETGEEKWRLETDRTVDTEPAVADGTLYVHSGGWLRAVDAETGELKWRFDTEGAVDKDSWHSIEPPSVADGTVYVGGYDAIVYALNAETGEPRWTYAFGQESPLHVTPVPHRGSLYAASEGVVALDETSEAAVTAAFEADQDGADEDDTFQVGEPVEFEALKSRGPIAEYEWDITEEEGIDARGQRVEHTFRERDDEFVTLRVRGDDGRVDTVERELNVVPWED